MSTSATADALRAATSQPSSTSSSTTSSGGAPGSWPNDTPELRRHRIAFYAKYGIELDPASPMSFVEQVMKEEHRIAKKTTKVVPFKMYEEEIAKLTADGCPSLQHVRKHDADGNVTTETVWMAKKSHQRGAMGRVVHSCNVFDVMVDSHSPFCAPCTDGRSLDVAAYARDLARVLHISVGNASNFLSTCPMCHPAAQVPVRQPLVSVVNGNMSSIASGMGSHASIAGSSGTLAKIPSLAAAPKAKQSEDLAEIPDFSGLARSFVEQVKAKINSIEPTDKANTGIRMLPEDGLHATVERLLVTQHEFRLAGKPTTIDLGYHYTQKEHMESIGETGLKTMSERKENGIEVVRNNGATYGEGIYTGSNPLGFHGYYGDVGLIVARLLGSNAVVNGDTIKGSKRLDKTSTHDSITVQRKLKIVDIVVVSTSKQCVPILQYNTRQLDPSFFTHPGNVALLKCSTELEAIVDRVLNAPPEELAIGRNAKAKPTIDLTLTAPSTTTSTALNQPLPQIPQAKASMNV
jgi:hypothetical protein